MDKADVGDGWMDVTGQRGGGGPTSEKMSLSKTGLTLGGLLLKKAGLEAGDRVRLLVNADKQWIRVRKSDSGETTSNKLSEVGTYSVMVSCRGVINTIDADLPQELEVLSVDDGDIVGGYR